MEDRRIRALREETLDWRFKAAPAAAHGLRLGEWLESMPHLSDLETPLAVLRAEALEHNLAAMAAWCAERGLTLAPHGKATMAPQLWHRQIRAGAAAVTVANLPQARVARAFGADRLLVANEVTGAAGAAWLAEWAAEGARITVFADSPAAAGVLARAGGGPLEVAVELGVAGGRGGARGIDAALAVAEAVRSAPNLRLAGVGGYEGAVTGETTPGALAAVDAYLRDLADLWEAVEFEVDRPMLTAGGSAYVDRVAAVLGPLAGPAEVVLRSGSYLIHDDGFYARLTPAARGADGPDLLPALEARTRVLSLPEPGLAILDAGRRDLPFDQGLPVPLGLQGARCTQISDQHLFLTGPLEDLDVGDVVALGLSHPCTAFDKWNLIPVVEEATGRVVDAIRTFF
ncbi:type III PLP-dependent enzyme domain-containing protein [Glycomyces xiaoerkulensis]|uniref:alanine racemase n=1 Tax=Glycomyces xiaoerkulensis TaxID=2038139 RepID=UPI000C256AF2|nr:alanine racemase [Glycomyces xiaoerkulensis]